jgi:hypothetical protein
LSGRGHVVAIDNFFTLVLLFLDLLESGTVATRTLRGNYKYVPRGLFAKHVIKHKEIGWIDYRKHRKRKICCAVWKDKQLLVLLSMHVEPAPPPGIRQFMWHKFGGRWKKVCTGPMHLQYTWDMRGVDTSDQIRGVYSSLSRSHKWWHRLFFYMLDTIVPIMWMIHSDLSFSLCTNHW